MRRKERGFTLMELMVVIVIVAILAAVAVPLYLNYVRDAQRTEAKGAMGAIITAEQVSFQREGVYKEGAPTTIEAALGIDLGEAKQNWDFSVEVTGTTAGEEGFTITAAPIATRPTKDVGNVTYTYSRDPANQPDNPWTP